MYLKRDIRISQFEKKNMFKDCTTTGQEDFPNTSFIINIINWFEPSLP